MIWVLLACSTPAPQTQTPAEPPALVSTAAQELDAMDPREPVPLQPMMAWHQKQNMQEHLEAIQGITDGLAQGDWEAVKVAAALLESSPHMQLQCEHMGAGAEGFTELALDFHSRADAIGVAAEEQDTQATLAATSHTLKACTSCHATYKQQVLGGAEWEQATGQEAPH